MPPVAYQTYDSISAARCLQASVDAYSWRPTIEVPGTSTEVLITEDDDCLIIAFRGTQQIQDWITDARFEFTYFCGSRVHNGFHCAITSVIDKVVAAVAGSKKPLLITGHSLGGALAVLCAYRLATKGIPIAAVYTFGQPRVGDAAFVHSYNSTQDLGARTWRIVNEEDIVPRIPGVLLGYRHCGQLMFHSSFPPGTFGNNYLLAKPSLWLMAASDAFGIWEGWKTGQLLDCLEDHYIAEYEKLSL